MLEIDGQIFDWDAEKNIANISKHGIPFKLAASVFSDQDAIATEMAVKLYELFLQGKQIKRSRNYMEVKDMIDTSDIREMTKDDFARGRKNPYAEKKIWIYY